MNQNPHAAHDDAADYYRGVSGRAYHEQKRGLRPGGRDWILRQRAAKFQRHVRPGDTVCELGVGAGWNLGRLQCGRRIGIDAADCLDETLKNLGIEFLEKIELVPAASIDVGICHHTLEHLLEPAAALRQFARVLKPGGHLILHVPWERERRHARYRPDEPNHHLYTWNAQNLGNLVTVTGYKINHIAVKKYGYDRFAANTADRLKIGCSGYALLRFVLLLLRPLHEVELVCQRA